MMSRDDYISKLFIDNEHKLDEAPANDLWGRLESKLDEELPVEQPSGQSQMSKVRGSQSPKGQSHILIRFAPYMAAASVLLLVVAVVAIMNNNNPLSQQKAMPLAEDMTGIEEVILDEEPQSIINSEEELAERFEEEDKKQAEKIIQTVKKSNSPKVTEKVASIDDVELKESESNDVILIEPEPYAEEATKAAEAVIELPEEDFSNNNSVAPSISKERQMVRPEEFRYNNNTYGEDFNNRSYGVPPSADPSLGDKLKEVEEIAKVTTTDQKTLEKKSYENRGLRSRKKNSSKRKANNMHTQIRMFDWMLGQFQDNSLDQGRSIETWRLLNPNTIEGVGVLMKGDDKIFEEKMLILHDPTQNRVLLKMYVDEDKNNFITYYLTNFDTERIIFEQAEYAQYPNKVIFQRLMNGFSTIIQQDNGFLKDQQQRYFGQRNNVSSVRAIRNLEQMD